MNLNKMYKFSQNWFLNSEIKAQIFRFLDPIGRHMILEIGCFEGQSSVFFADRFLTHSESSLTCVDPFLTITDNDHSNLLVENQAELAFDHNMSQCRNREKISIHKTTSDNFFDSNDKIFTFIYIDGSHEPENINRDIKNSFKWLSTNGIIWMDDYRGGRDGKIKEAIDSTLNNYIGSFEIIFEGYQLAIRKI